MKDGGRADLKAEGSDLLVDEDSVRLLLEIDDGVGRGPLSGGQSGQQRNSE